MTRDWTNETPDAVWNLWFPADLDDTDREAVGAFWTTRMQGGMDEIIISDFTETTIAAAEGRLDHWAATPKGRLALIIALDQFPRSLWRDTPAAFGQDIKATRLVLEGLENGHYDALEHIFQQQFCIINLTHCEGPDHLARMELARDLNAKMRDYAPEHLQMAIDSALDQVARVTGIIAEFGRHPHRNPILGRLSTPAEQAYIEKGDFPHERKVQDAET